MTAEVAQVLSPCGLQLASPRGVATGTPKEDTFLSPPRPIDLTSLGSVRRLPGLDAGGQTSRAIDVTSPGSVPRLPGPEASGLASSQASGQASGQALGLLERPTFGQAPRPEGRDQASALPERLRRPSPAVARPPRPDGSDRGSLQTAGFVEDAARLARMTRSLEAIQREDAGMLERLPRSLEAGSKLVTFLHGFVSLRRDYVDQAAGLQARVEQLEKQLSEQQASLGAQLQDSAEREAAAAARVALLQREVAEAHELIRRREEGLDQSTDEAQRLCRELAEARQVEARTLERESEGASASATGMAHLKLEVARQGEELREAREAAAARAVTVKELTFHVGHLEEELRAARGSPPRRAMQVTAASAAPLPSPRAVLALAPGATFELDPARQREVDAHRAAALVGSEPLPASAEPFVERVRQEQQRARDRQLRSLRAQAAALRMQLGEVERSQGSGRSGARRAPGQGAPHAVKGGQGAEEWAAVAEERGKCAKLLDSCYHTLNALHHEALVEHQLPKAAVEQANASLRTMKGKVKDALRTLQFQQPLEGVPDDLVAMLLGVFQGRGGSARLLDNALALEWMRAQGRLDLLEFVFQSVATQAAARYPGEDVPEEYQRILEEVDLRGWDGMHWIGNFTLLHRAARERRPGLCRACLARGARPGLRDDAGLSALDYARLGGYGEVLEVLQRHWPLPEGSPASAAAGAAGAAS